MISASLPLQLLPFGAVVLSEPGVTIEEMRRDLENIRQLGFNTIVLYPSVSRWEGEPFGHTAFGSIDAIMDLCAELGLKVILELQGQVMQDADAPECFPLPPGFPHPEYRENGFHLPAKERLLERYLREVAAHFKGHPALLAYDLFNEIGNDSRSPETIRAFVQFLEQQYKSDIRAMNLAWATYFKNFEAIAAAPANYRIWSWSSVVAERDWQRFRSADFRSQVGKWSSIIREIDPAVPLFIDVLGSDVLHNRTDGYYGVSDWDVVEESDLLGLSCYANMLDEKWWEHDFWLWPMVWRHALSVADGKQVIISELMTANRNLFPTEGSSMTDEIRLWSFQALFHGIKGLIYWKYRPFRRGRQVGGRGLTNASGEINAHGWQAAEAARFANEHAEALANAHPDDAGCAILHDPEAERLYAAIGIGADSAFYAKSHRGWFRAFWSAGIQPSYSTPARIAQGVPERIRVLVIPCHANLSEELAAVLHAFVRRGGVLVTESRFGTIDDEGNLWPESPGAGACRWMGIRETDFTCRLRDFIAFQQGDLTFRDDYFQELDISQSAEILLRTNTGRPALIQNNVEAGQHLHFAFHFGHVAERDFSNAVTACFDRLLERLQPGLRPRVLVESKLPRVDVSILLNQENEPWLAGVCNFEEQPARAILRCEKPVLNWTSSDPACTVEQQGDRIMIQMAHRSIATLYFSK